jgi:hypothetical protein
MTWQSPNCHFEIAQENYLVAAKPSSSKKLEKMT